MSSLIPDSTRTYPEHLTLITTENGALPILSKYEFDFKTQTSDEYKAPVSGTITVFERVPDWGIVHAESLLRQTMGENPLLTAWREVPLTEDETETWKALCFANNGGLSSFNNFHEGKMSKLVESSLYERMRGHFFPNQLREFTYSRYPQYAAEQKKRGRR